MSEKTSGRGRLGLLVALIALAALAAIWFALSEPWVASDPLRGPEPSSAAPALALSPSAAESGASEATRMPALAAPGEREIALVLLRFPDHAPIAHRLVEIEPRAVASEEPWLATGDDGRVSVRVPVSARALRVRAMGFEPAEAHWAPTDAELRVALTPSSGLFGHVVLPDRTPAADAEVELLAKRQSVTVQVDAGVGQPKSNVWSTVQVVATARTSAEGWYFLEHPTRDKQDSVVVQARLKNFDGKLEVQLPRAPEELVELVLAEPAKTLLVRVVGEDGQPIPGARVTRPEGPLASGRDRTDERGELAISATELPAVLFASAEGFHVREWRHDGRVVASPEPVEVSSEFLEIVLAPLPGARVRIVDAETHLPLVILHGRCELVANGQTVGHTAFEPDSQGRAWVSFQDESRQGNPTESPDLARLTLQKEGYDNRQVFELDALAPPQSEPVELALRPLADWGLLRGRVVRAAEPVARFQVGLRAMPRFPKQPNSQQAFPSWQYERAYTDAAGRFALRWQRGAIEQVVAVAPHWTKSDEFAFIGPLSEEAALSQEHVLELGPAAFVPALVRGVVRGGRYRYYVNLLEGSGADQIAVSTTINGFLLVADADGELRTLLRLPSDRRVQVTIGHADDSAIHPEGSPPVEHDPTAPRLPLVFDVQPIFARVRGRVTNVAPTELGHLALTLLEAEDPEARRSSSSLTQPGPDGGFDIQAPLGRYDLFLIDATPGSARSVLARESLVLERDVDGLLLAPDPLPADPR